MLPNFDKDYFQWAKIFRKQYSKHNSVNKDATFPPTYYQDLGDQSIPGEDYGTTHFSVVDSQRNVVALTSTVEIYFYWIFNHYFFFQKINLAFGSLIISDSTGILLNDEMDDFSSPNQSNSYNFPPSKANLIVKGKRPLSSMVNTTTHKNWLLLNEFS